MKGNQAFRATDEKSNALAKKIIKENPIAEMYYLTVLATCTPNAIINVGPNKA